MAKSRDSPRLESSTGLAARNHEGPARLARACEARSPRPSVEIAALRGDETGFEPLEAWRAHDRHLLEWEANQRENVLRSRRERYRLFARKMATYHRIVVEKLDLRDFAELPPKPSEEEPRLRASRGRRFAASLSELLA